MTQGPVWDAFKCRTGSGADLLNSLADPMASLFHGRPGSQPHPSSRDPAAHSALGGTGVVGCVAGSDSQAVFVLVWVSFLMMWLKWLVVIQSIQLGRLLFFAKDFKKGLGYKESER